MPKPLDTGRLSKFEPRPRAEKPTQTEGQGGAPKARNEPSAPPSPSADDYREQSPAQTSRWRSRAPIVDGQISIKAPLDTLDRFRQMCADDRRTYGAMLEILMDRFEGKN